jgi:hypothetical protein
MLRKLALGLAAAASLSAFAPWGGGWGGGFHHFHGFHVGYFGGQGYDDGGCYVTRRVMTPFGYRLRTVNVCD